MFVNICLIFIMSLLSNPVISFTQKFLTPTSTKFSLRRFSIMASKQSDSISLKTGFMFPGQGAQNVGMLDKVCHDHPAAKSLFSKASNILGYDLLEKCTKGPKEELDSTVISQPAIFVSSMAALELLKETNPKAYESATVAMGLSLGEYSALCFAGVFSFEDGVRLTKARGEAMQAAADSEKSGMVAIIGLDIAGTNKICEAAQKATGQKIAIANYLCDGNYAISGGILACQHAQSVAKSMGAKMAMKLAVAGAFHTDYMSPAVPALKLALSKVQFQRPRIPVFSNVNGLASFDEKKLKENLESQVTSPVQWESIMNTVLKAPEFGSLYEIGPGTVCKGIVKRMDKKAEVVTVTV